MLLLLHNIGARVCFSVFEHEKAVPTDTYEVFVFTRLPIIEYETRLGLSPLAVGVTFLSSLKTMVNCNYTRAC